MGKDSTTKDGNGQSVVIEVNQKLSVSKASGTAKASTGSRTKAE